MTDAVSITMDLKKYTFPFRLGKKTKRAILDANGIEVIVFPIGHEEMADFTLTLYNNWHIEMISIYEEYKLNSI